MSKYVVYIEDGDAWIDLTADDVRIGHNSALDFLDYTRQKPDESSQDYQVVAHFPPGSYNFFYLDGVADVG